MSEFHQVVKIDGKGFGCVATKDIKRGTLILREQPEIICKRPGLVTPVWIKSLEKSFKQMNKNNQEEFLKLHNGFLDQDLSSNQRIILEQRNLRSILSQMYESAHEREKILVILGICSTNAFQHDCMKLLIHVLLEFMHQDSTILALQT